MNAAPTVVDLFCGCGGLSTGFRLAGFRVLAGAEWNARPLATFAANFPDALAIEGDLSLVDPEWLRQRVGLKHGQLDVLIGGPPCQGWSKNVPARLRSRDDPRNSLMARFVDFVQDLRPAFVLIENVAEMQRAYASGPSELLLCRLGELGYATRQDRRVAADFGVPQRRRRTFIVAARGGGEVPAPVKDLPGFPAEVSAWAAMSDLPSLAAGARAETYRCAPQNAFQRWARRDATALTDHDARPLRPRQLERVRALPPGSGAGAKDLPPHLRPRMSYSGAYARLWPDQPARTITKWVFHPGSGRFFHPFDDRTVTIREAARLQGFPDDFRFAGSFVERSHMIGEAVPPLLALAYANGILEQSGRDLPAAM